MIILHRTKSDSFADHIEDTLVDLVLAYKTELHEDSNHSKETNEPRLPFIDENGSIISGKDEISDYLMELSTELKKQRIITGDGCYIDPETGKIC